MSSPFDARSFRESAQFEDAIVVSLRWRAFLRDNTSARIVVFWQFPPKEDQEKVFLLDQHPRTTRRSERQKSYNLIHCERSAVQFFSVMLQFYNRPQKRSFESRIASLTEEDDRVAMWLILAHSLTPIRISWVRTRRRIIAPRPHFVVYNWYR